jgi:hypothetical protein
MKNPITEELQLCFYAKSFCKVRVLYLLQWGLGRGGERSRWGGEWSLRKVCTLHGNWWMGVSWGAPCLGAGLRIEGKKE